MHSQSDFARERENETTKYCEQGVCDYLTMLGNMKFHMNQPNVYGLITARISRPTGFVLAQGLFRPSEFLGEITEGKPTVIKTLGLRLVGSAVHGGPLSVCEFVPSALEFIGGEIWSGEGSLLFTGASEFSALHQLPILGSVEATAFYNSSFRLRRPAETYPFTV